MARNKKSLAAVVLGMSATGLSVCRSMGRKDIKVYGIDWDKQGPAAYSRYAEPNIAPNVIEDESNFIDYLVEFGRKFEQPVPLLCAHDEYVAAVSRHREKLEPYFIFNIPYKETVENFLDKRRSYEIAKRCGIACPATYFVAGEEELKKIIGSIRFPCALKPAISHLWRTRIGWKKLIPVNSPEELLANFIEIRKAYPEIMIQELIPGGDDQIYLFYAYFNRRGELIASFIPRKIRQNPIHFGVGSFSVSEMDREVEDAGMRLLKGIKYCGIGAPELKRDSVTGEIKFMELNMRFIMIGELAIASGVDLPYIMYQDLIGKEPKTVSTFIEGVGLLNFELDAESFWDYRRHKEMTLARYLRSFKGLRKIAFTYFAWDDLRPFLFIYAGFIKRLCKIMLKTVKKVFAKDIFHQGSVVR